MRPGRHKLQGIRRRRGKAAVLAAIILVLIWFLAPSVVWRDVRPAARYGPPLPIPEYAVNESELSPGQRDIYLRYFPGELGPYLADE